MYFLYIRTCTFHYHASMVYAYCVFFSFGRCPYFFLYSCILYSYNLAYLTGTTALFDLYPIFCGFLYVSDCCFHYLSFPYDICAFIVLVNEPVFEGFWYHDVPMLRYHYIFVFILTMIVYWSFLCEILHYYVYFRLFICEQLALWCNGHITSFIAFFSVTFLHYVQCFSMSLSLICCRTMCHVIGHLIPIWHYIIVIIVWVHIWIILYVVRYYVSLPIRRVRTSQCAILVVSSIVCTWNRLLYFICTSGSIGLIYTRHCPRVLWHLLVFIRHC